MILTYRVDIVYVIDYNGGTKGLDKMFTLNATNVRKEWSSVVDSVIREKPKFIKRTHDYMFLSDFTVLENLLKAYTFSATAYTESDSSVTLSLQEIDLAENGKDLADTKLKLAGSILNYAEDFYHDFEFWSSAPNRKGHIPYVIKALMIGDAEKIGESLKIKE